MSEPTKEALEAAMVLHDGLAHSAAKERAWDMDAQEWRRKFVDAAARTLDSFAASRDERIAQLEGLIREACGRLGESCDQIVSISVAGLCVWTADTVSECRSLIDRLDRALSPVAPTAGEGVRLYRNSYPSGGKTLDVFYTTDRDGGGLPAYVALPASVHAEREALLREARGWIGGVHDDGDDAVPPGQDDLCRRIDALLGRSA